MELNEITITKIIAESVKTDFSGVDIWPLCNGMEIETITGYRVIFSLAPTKEGQYLRACKYVDIGISSGEMIAQSQTRHSMTIDYSNPESMAELYKFIRRECFMKRPFRLREYAVWAFSSDG